MKFIYKAPTEESALFFRHSAERELKYLDDFEAKWGKEYPLAVRVGVTELTLRYDAIRGKTYQISP